MRNRKNRYFSGLSKGLCLTALLVSAGALAETDTPSADKAAQSAENSQAVNAHVADSGKVLERKRAYEAASARSRPSSTKRVYLEDYERIHRPVGRQLRTTTYWVGQKGD